MIVLQESEIWSGNEKSWWFGLLELEDLEYVDPGRGRVLQQLHQLNSTKLQILADQELSDDEKAEKVGLSRWTNAPSHP